MIYSCQIVFVILLALSGNHCDELKNDFVNSMEQYFKTGKTELSPECEQQITFYIEGLHLTETWAIRMYDAGVNVPLSGILDGNTIDLGSFDECINIRHTKNSTNISGRYCIGKTQVSFNSSEILKSKSENEDSSSLSPKSRIAPDNNKREVQIAKCFPSACSAEEMQKIYANCKIPIIITFDNRTCQTEDDRSKLDSGAIATISVYGVLLGIVVVSTAYDVVIYYLEKKPLHSIFTSFSLLMNSRTLLRTGYHSNEISCMHGLRVISTMWIIMDHRYSIQFQHPTRNSFYHFNWLNSEGSMFILSATISVDTFLLLSGTLISYNFLRASSKFNILFHYLHRYLRLTPVLVIVIIFHMYLLKYIGSGPYWPSVIERELVEGCEVHWWKALLYIQNIFGRGKPMCIPQTWYLSLDMQLFIVSPFLIVPLKKWPKLGLIATAALLIMSMITCFLTGWFYELNAFMQGNHGFEKQMDYVWMYYFQIHTRAGPWLIGIILGYLIFENKAGRIKLVKSKIIIAVLWINALITLFLCVFAGHRLIKGADHRLENSIHLALVRPAWAIATSWIIFACVNGRGGPINWFLSLPTFQVVSKLTYTLYIVHYPILYILTTQMRVVPIFNNLEAMYKFWGDFAFSILVSAILTITIEFPFATIDKILLGRTKKKNNAPPVPE